MTEIEDLASYVAGAIHRNPSPHYSTLDDQTWFPIKHSQLRDLLGKVLTQLDALSLPDRAHRAARSLIVAEFWRWWNEACDSACTSYAGCLAPVVMATGSEDTPSNRWGWASEQAYLDSLVGNVS